MRQFLNILLAMMFTFTNVSFAQTKVDGSLLKGNVIGGTAGNARRIVLPKDTKANLDALTRLEANVVYGTDTQKAYVDNGTALVAIGSGSGGVNNLITNGNADDATATIFVPYADAAGTRPVDGTGGSPNVTTSVTSTTPLEGTKSYLLTKTAVNYQGQGWSIPFTVDPAYRAKSLKISIDYIVNSGTFVAGTSTTDSDVIWYIYDVTNSQLIEPSNIKLFSNSSTTSDKFEATFQTSVTGSSYRLIAHVASTSASAYELKVDNITVTPSQYVYAPVVTDLISYGTLTIGATTTAPTKGSIGTDIIRMARVGDNARIQGVYYQNALGSAAAGSGDYLFTLPGGVSFDSTKVKFEATLVGLNSWGNGTQLGSASASNGVAATDQGVGVILPYDATRFRIGILYTNGSATTKGVIGSGYFNLVHATRSISFDFQAPIQGWSSNQQISDGYDARDLRVNVLRSTNLTGLNPNNTSIKIPIAPTTIEDTYSGWDATNNRVLIKSAKSYDISYGAWIESTNVVSGQYYIVQLMKNGIEIDSTQMQFTSMASQFMRLPGGKKAISAVAGDYFEVWIYSSANHSSSTLTARRVWLDVQAVQAPTTMSRGVTVGANYSTTATTSYTSGSLAVFAPNTKISDYGAGGTYNTATGEFTANTSMQLQVDYHIQFSSASWTANTRLSMVLYKNGSTSGQENTSPYAQSTQSFVMADKGTFTIDVVAGDVIKIMVDQNSTSSKSLAGFAATNRITFKRAGG